MNQQTLARMLRIQCVEKISDIDLPGFLIDTIESSLTTINAYKLTNILENIDTLHTDLSALGTQYSHEVASVSQTVLATNRHRNIIQYLTNALLLKNKSTTLSLSKTEALRLKNVYSITCLIKLKEYMHRNTTVQAPSLLPHQIRLTATHMA